MAEVKQWEFMSFKTSMKDTEINLTRLGWEGWHLGSIVSFGLVGECIVFLQRPLIEAIKSDPVK